MIARVLFALLIIIFANGAEAKDCSFVNQDFLAKNGHSVLAARWCLQCATSKIKDHPFKGNCGKYVLSWGDKHQNALGRDAIVAACRGEDQEAVKRIEVCQCHNPAEEARVRGDQARMLQWMRTDGAKIAQIDCNREQTNALNASQIRAAQQNGPQIDSACVSKLKKSITGNRVVVELSNKCGKCAHINNFVTLNGQQWGAVGVKTNVQPGEAFDVAFFMDREGTYDVQIGQVFACPSS